MISLPSSSRLLAAIQRDLTEIVRPAVSDAAALASLDMIDALLRSIAVRCDHEVAWMQEEIAAVESLAYDSIAAGVDDGRVKLAFEKFAESEPSDRSLAGLQRRYDLAGNLLSACIEIGLRDGGELRERAEAAMEQRLAHEVTIRGEFSLAGRT